MVGVVMQSENIFGMSMDEISQIADALSYQRDQVDLTKPYSYQSFIETMKRGHNKLMNLKGYNVKAY
jgi:hypothetical protein